MKQFILPSPPDQQGVIRLYGRDFHYLVRVRRLKPGSVINALLPSGGKVCLKVRSLDGECLTGDCLVSPPFSGGDSAPAADFPEYPARPAEGDGLPPIILFQALPKGAKMDLIVRQAVEGGIREIRPFVSGYSASKIPPSGQAQASGGRLERWRRIIKEARQQSGSPVATEIAPPCSVDALLDYWEALKKDGVRVLGIMLHQDPLVQGSFHDYLSTSPDAVVLAVGPEGGFTPEEVSRFLMAGFNPLVMGNTVLRTETAALYAAAAVRIILWESTIWTLITPRR
jgi:16S rRNA (uracil1498-N3)-methyltransferase